MQSAVQVVHSDQPDQRTPVCDVCFFIGMNVQVQIVKTLLYIAFNKWRVGFIIYIRENNMHKHAPKWVPRYGMPVITKCVFACLNMRAEIVFTFYEQILIIYDAYCGGAGETTTRAFQQARAKYMVRRKRLSFEWDSRNHKYYVLLCVI